MKLFNRNPCPHEVKVEVSRRCNLNCRMCYRPALPVLPDMTLGDFKLVVWKLRKVKVLCPHGYGEPLVNPSFLDMMRYASGLGIQVHLVTNGTLLTRELARQFIRDCHPLKITFSIDAGIPKAYEWIRRGSKFQTVVCNIADVVAEADGQVPIALHCALGTYNMEQVMPLSKLGYKLGVDMVEFNDLTLYNVGLADAEHALRTSGRVNLVEDRVAEARNCYGQNVNISFSSPARSRCRYPWQNLFVQADGECYVCTDTLSYPLGSLLTQPLKKIWHGKRMKAFRDNFEVNPLDWCRKCSNYGR